MIRVLLADDQALVRGAMGALLDLEPDIEVVAQVGRGDEAVAAARESGVDVCLLDIQMPGIDGVEAARQLRDQLPDARVVMVTTFDRPGYLKRAVDAGAVGFVMRPPRRRGLQRWCGVPTQVFVPWIRSSPMTYCSAAPTP